MRVYLITSKEKIELEEPNTFELGEIIWLEDKLYHITRIERKFEKSANNLFETQNVFLDL